MTTYYGLTGAEVIALREALELAGLKPLELVAWLSDSGAALLEERARALTAEAKLRRIRTVVAE